MKEEPKSDIRRVGLLDSICSKSSNSDNTSLLNFCMLLSISARFLPAYLTINFLSYDLGKSRLFAPKYHFMHEYFYYVSYSGNLFLSEIHSIAKDLRCLRSSLF